MIKKPLLMNLVKVKVIQTNLFQKSVKKLHKNQKKVLNKAIRKILSDTVLGPIKKDDLADVRVYKFKMLNQLILLAYTYNDKDDLLTLLALGTHENFYRDLKKSKQLFFQYNYFLGNFSLIEKLVQFAFQ